MSEIVEIKVRDNGSLKINGPVRVVDNEGNLLRETNGEPIALCRCGASADKPFCDGAHRECGFESVIRAES
ncbi:MAG: CDGSH iron-sulfur domain-containing protein [Actinobacteria bacterium]|uniref:Unannotated protein n=1 Tax=freshwater metagenome TaxID=449393 RepID=A0A6J7E3G5_9ZZZZ|nr:CDGSH iron-sulfur domain-containing protein [Actinomycetota bacterium]